MMFVDVDQRYLRRWPTLALTLSLSLSVSPCNCLLFVSYKNLSATGIHYQLNTRFDCIRLFSFHR